MRFRRETQAVYWPDVRGLPIPRKVELPTLDDDPHLPPFESAVEEHLLIDEIADDLSVHQWPPVCKGYLQGSRK